MYNVDFKGYVSIRDVNFPSLKYLEIYKPVYLQKKNYLMFIFQLTLNLLRHTSYAICKIRVAHIYPCQKNDQNQQVSSTFNFLMTLIYNNE